MALICEGCKDGPVYSLTYTDKKWLCSKCYRPPVQLNDALLDFGRTYLPGYGWEKNSRLKEMKRRYILPYSDGDNGYFVGRLNERGKIEEREPDY